MARIAGHGVNGDPLHEGKLDLPELLEAPSVEEQAWAADFVAGRRWQEAVTHREKAPHEYSVRQWVGTSGAGWKQGTDAAGREDSRGGLFRVTR